MFKVNNKNTRTMSVNHSGIFIDNFEHIYVNVSSFNKPPSHSLDLEMCSFYLLN